jgi:hypothetical protein
MSGIIKSAQMHEFGISGRHDLVGDTLKLALMDGDFSPAMQYNINWSDISANEVSGTGYTADGKALTGRSLSYDALGNCTFNADNVTWTGLDVGEISYAVLLNHTPSVYNVLAFWELDITVEGSDFTVVWSNDGIFTFTRQTAGVYKSYYAYMLDALIDLNTDTLKMMLVKNYNPDVVNDEKYSDVSSYEVSGTGYVAGGEEVNVPASYGYARAVEPDQCYYSLSPDDVEWSALDCDTPSHAILYNATHADKPLLFHFPVAAAPDGGPYRLEWPDDVPDPIYPSILYDGWGLILEQ